MRRNPIEERSEIAQLRNEGFTLQEIANHFGKSVYWVNSRINPTYAPKRLRNAATGSVRPIELSLPDDAPPTFTKAEIGRLYQDERIPVPVAALMTEIDTAVQSKLYRLAAMGIRAVLEVMMKEKIGDRPFKVMIDEFQKAGYLSIRQASVLESMIEAGHAAIHRGWEPSGDDIATLVGVTKSLIEIVYLHEDRARELDRKVPRRQAPAT